VQIVDVLQPYDFLMLAVLILCTVFGAWKGMAWQLAALASVLVSVGVAIHASPPLAPYFKIQQPWNRCVAMLVLYLATSLAIWVLFRFVAGIIDRVRLKEFDRQVGALFGAAKGVLWCLVITFFVVTLSESARQSVLRSRSGYYTAVLIRRARPVLPQDLRDLLGEYIDELDRKLDPGEEAPPSGGPSTADLPQYRTANTASGNSQ
jgi:membrane protein required for colicin V production